MSLPGGQPAPSSVSREALLAQMQAYGLEEAEASIYYHLCKLGPARAASVAEESEHKRTDTYRLLDRLVEKGFASKSLERPARYIPLPAESAIQQALALRRRRTEELAQAQEELVAAWPRPAGVEAATRQSFAVHQGRAQIDSLLARVIRSAEEEILVAVTTDGMARLDSKALRRALQEAAARGIHVRVLAKRHRDGALAFDDIPQAEVRHSDLPSFYQALIVDARETILGVAAGRGSGGVEETMLWLNSSDMVLAQKALYDLAWAQSLTAAELATKTPRYTRVLRGRWVRTNRLRDLLLGAQFRISIRAPAVEAGRWEAHGITQALTACAARGVSVVVVLPEGGPRIPGATMMIGETESVAALVDDTLLMAFPGPSAGMHDDAEWAMESTEPALVRIANLDLGRIVRPATTSHPS